MKCPSMLMCRFRIGERVALMCQVTHKDLDLGSTLAAGKGGGGLCRGDPGEALCEEPGERGRSGRMFDRVSSVAGMAMW